MRIHIIAVGKRMPAWVQQGYQEYAKRLTRDVTLELTEVAAAVRGKSSDLKRQIAEEGGRLLDAIPSRARVVALDERGKPWSTAQLSQQIEVWKHTGDPVALLVGGADGLAPVCLQEARQHWSLSRLTLPHPLVRVVLAEQLYRAWSLAAGHPYHRA